MEHHELDAGPGPVLRRRELLTLTGLAGLTVATAACSDASGNSAARATAVGSSTSRAVAPVSADTPTQPSTPNPTTPVVAASRPLLCRASWGAAPTRLGGIEQTPNRLTLHHSAVIFDDNRTIAARLRQHQHYHQDDHGWIDIAYHVAVDREGNLFELRPFNLVGDTATDYDPTGHFLVLVEGNFDEQPINDYQLDGAAMAFAWAAQTWGIPTESLKGHRDVPAQTTCPGSNLEAHITSGDLEKRIDTLLESGLVELPTLCGPEADAIVAAIEAGR